MSEKKYLYIFADLKDNICKVGVSNHPEIRRQNTERASGRDLILWYAEEHKFAVIFEALILRKFTDKAVKGEWLLIEPKEITDFIRDGLREMFLKSVSFGEDGRPKYTYRSIS